MFENSPAGLRMLAAEVSVTVTREEAHQAVLARYPVYPGQERRVAVELVWCRIDTGKYRGQRAIEVRLDESRVGELSFLMSQRYAALIEQVRTQGGRPGCEAYLERDARGLQLSLRLPREAEDVTSVTPLPAAAQQPLVPKPQRTKSEKRAMWIVAASVVFVVFLLAGIFGGDVDEPTTPLSGDTTRTTTFEPPPTTTTTTTTPPPTTTTTTTPPAPLPPTQPPVQPPPVEVPVQPSGCDPNYTGCVPIDSDVDCAGGSGNGPSYADGPVQVIGNDIYDLDRDNDGTACE